MLLTKQGGFIVKPISILLGKILSLIYDVLSNIDIASIGIAIILFTIFIRLLLLPMMVKQNKSTKVMNYIQPEINKIAKKYRGKKDQESMLAQQRETKQIQDKYGVSLTSGCLTSLIQFPIFIALYTVIQNIPAYVDRVKELYIPIADKIYGNPDAIAKLSDFKNQYAATKVVELNEANYNTIIDVLAKFPTDAWNKFAELFKGDELSGIISTNSAKLGEIYQFAGCIDLTHAPGFALTAAFAIPVLSLIFQFLSMHVTPQQTPSDPAQEASMKTMKTMLYVMPLFSFFITVSVPAGVGLYWATGSFISYITSLCINAYFNHCDMEKVVNKSMEKAAKKAAKRKAKGKKSFMDKLQEAALGQAPDENNAHNSVAGKSLKSYTSSTMNVNEGNTRYREGSLASKANVMQRYNDSNGGK